MTSPVCSCGASLADAFEVAASMPNPEIYGPNVLVDGDMEAAGVADWGSWVATLTKAGAPHSGTQCLRVTANAGAGVQVPMATQSPVTAGKRYLVRGWARSDIPGHAPLVYDNVNILWNGTTSTSWQYFNFVIVAATAAIFLAFIINNPVGTEYVEFDDIEVREIYAPSEFDGVVRCARCARQPVFAPPAGVRGSRYSAQR